MCRVGGSSVAYWKVNWRLEVGGWRLEVGGWRSAEVGEVVGGRRESIAWSLGTFLLVLSHNATRASHTNFSLCVFASANVSSFSS